MFLCLLNLFSRTLNLPALTEYVYVSVRKQYVDLLSSDPRKAISQFDYDIDQKCGHLLNSEKTFSELKGSTGKYCHIRQHTVGSNMHDDRTILLDFLVTVKAAPHECVIRTCQPLK